MRDFVTSATGFIGGHVARQLIAAGHTVTALVRNTAIAQALAAGDVTDKESMRFLFVRAPKQATLCGDPIYSLIATIRKRR